MSRIAVKSFFLLTLALLGVNGYASTISDRANLLNGKQVLSGPNCWNIVHNISGNYPFFLLMTSEQNKLLYKENCVKVNTSIENAPNDSLIRYFGDDGADLHSFVSLGNGAHFQKGSNLRSNPYEITDLKSIDANYGKTALCIDIKNCNWSAEVYKCKPQGFKKSNSKIALRLNNLAQSFSNFLTTDSIRKTVLDKFINESSNLLDSTGDSEEINIFLKTASRSELFLIFDISQTVRFLSKESVPSKLQNSFQKAKLNIEYSVWNLSTALIKMQKNATSLTELIFDFAYGASYANGLQDQILLELTKVLGQYVKNNNLKEGNDIIASNQLMIISNPRIKYDSASSIFNKNIKLYSAGKKHLLASLVYAAKSSASNLSDARLFLASVKNIVAQTDDQLLKRDHDAALRRYQK